jgi:chaperonin GroES
MSDEYNESPAESKSEGMNNLKLLRQYAKLDNLVDQADLSYEGESHKNCVDKIGKRVLAGFDEDMKSCSEWLDDIKKVEALTTLKAVQKNQPLPNSSNVKYPLITKACYEFSSRTYPEIIKDGKVVKGNVIGLSFTKDAQDLAERTTTYMNYQLLFEQEDWEMELDKLLNLLPLIGFLCRKTYYDPIRRVIKSELCEPKDLIINSNAKSLQDARRISHVLHFSLNELIEHQNADLFCREPIDELIVSLENDSFDKPIDVIEQHTFLDLDDDDYAEPYIVTILKETGKVLRIVPRFNKDSIITKGSKLLYIEPIQSFTDYHFLVSPKGKFQSVGFGILMMHLNQSINSILNMLIDSGQLSNMQGGYKDSRLKNIGSGDTDHDPGEWKTVKAMAGVTLREGLVPHMYKEPSETLFKLLGLLIQTGKDLSSSTEVMTGGTSADNAKTGAVQALQAQGLKIFTSIQRRIYRSLTAEFKKIFILNGEYLDETKYYHVIDQPNVVNRNDFDMKKISIMPVADPNLSSEFQRSQKNQLLLGISQLKGANPIAITKMIIDNSELHVPAENIMLTPQQMNKPDPEMVKIQAEIQSWAEDKKLKAEELSIRQFEAKIKFFQTHAQVIELRARSLMEMAQAQAVQDDGLFKQHSLQLAILTKQIDSMSDMANLNADAIMHNNEMNMKQQELAQNAPQQQQGGTPSAAATPQAAASQ